MFLNWEGCFYSYFFIHYRKDSDFDILTSILRMTALHNRLLFSASVKEMVHNVLIHTGGRYMLKDRDSSVFWLLVCWQLIQPTVDGRYFHVHVANK
ncbi:hypothetical protein C8R41DRAFT_848575 [Lentinula lateritia]|uniref:Uncharacterized protein n=1 Tax=Lentinula lateritia TaxID=40482 RepID=A0ABQ8V562_9AGAR|nr:hypothetical protein C8R41DRAFT_848575 [Lentinula lateritia]